MLKIFTSNETKKKKKNLVGLIFFFLKKILVGLNFFFLKKILFGLIFFFLKKILFGLIYGVLFFTKFVGLINFPPFFS